MHTFYLTSASCYARLTCGDRRHTVNTDIAFALAIELMDEWGLTDNGWSFKFDHARKRFGYCSYTKRQISLSRYLTELNDEAHVRDTILHEIAHALSVTAYGYAGKGHNHLFYSMCRKVGAEPSRCYSENVEQPPHKWEGTCPNCGKVYKRMRLKKVAKTYACTPCCKRYNNNTYTERFRLQWRDVSNEYATT